MGSFTLAFTLTARYAFQISELRFFLQRVLLPLPFTLESNQGAEGREYGSGREFF